MANDASPIAIHLLESSSLPIICLHSTPATYVKLPNYVAPAKDIESMLAHTTVMHTYFPVKQYSPQKLEICSSVVKI